MVKGLKPGNRVFQSRGMLTGNVPCHTGYPGFVVCHPDPDTVTQVFGDNASIFSEMVGRVAVGPPAFILEGLRQVVMEQADVWFDLLSEQFIHQTIVEIQSSLVDGTGALREDAGPGS